MTTLRQLADCEDTSCGSYDYLDFSKEVTAHLEETK